MVRGDDDGAPTDVVDRIEPVQAALRRLYGDLAPVEYAPNNSLDLGGAYPLDLIRVYPVDQPGPAHWHYVSAGLSALYPEGRGHELTLRLTRPPGETSPPLWGCAVLLELGRYLVESGRRFEVGHHIAPRWRAAPGDPPTELCAFVFAADPVLGRVGSGAATLQFLQAVGMTADESELVDRGGSAPAIALLAQGNPLLVTDRARTSLLAPRPEEFGALLDDQLSWRRDARTRTVEVTLGAEVVRHLVRTLRGAIPQGKPVILAGGRGSLVVFKPAPASFCQVQPDGLVLGVSEAMLAELDALLPERGVYPLPTLAGVSLNVLPVHIRDPDGKLVRTVG